MIFLKFKRGYFLSSKGLYANVVSMLDDGNELIRFTGTAKSLIEDIYATTTRQKLLEKILTLHPQMEKKQIEDFLTKFLSDLTELDVLEHA